MPQPQDRRRRQCGPKTRTGCQTCKVRRVKCDEARPSCHRCKSTGRKCDGYAKDVLTATSDEIGSVALIQRISTHLQGTPQEKRGFNFFINQTSPELNGFYSGGFWESYILQASHSEPSLRHAVIAIGSLHEDFSQQNSIKTPGKNPADNGERMRFALNQYTKALGHLRRSLVASKEQPLTALLSCILFVCFDSLRGYYQSSMIHLQSGMRILRELRKQATVEDPMLENTIVPLFVRLGAQSILYIDTSKQGERARFAAELSQVVSRERVIPEEFPTLEAARTTMNECADGLFRIFYFCDGDKPMRCQPSIAAEISEKYIKKLCEWDLSFEKFMNTHSKSFTSKQVRGAALLKIHHTAVRIMAYITPSLHDERAMADAVNSPVDFEKYTDDFQVIINLSRSLIIATEADAKNGKPALTFSTDLGLIAPLYYTGLKCASKKIREEALELLKHCPRREGMWDSVAAVHLITEYWGIRKRQDALNEEVAFGEISLPVRIKDIVDLVFHDGGGWQWIWKPSRSDSPLSVAASTSSPDTTTDSEDSEGLKNILVKGGYPGR